MLLRVFFSDDPPLPSNFPRIERVRFHSDTVSFFVEEETLSDSESSGRALLLRSFTAVTPVNIDCCSWKPPSDVRAIGVGSVCSNSIISC